MLSEALRDAGEVDTIGGAGEALEPPTEAWFDTLLVWLELEARRAFLDKGWIGVKCVLELARALAVERGISALVPAIEA